MTLTSRVATDNTPGVEVPLDLRVRQHTARARKLQSAAVAEFLADSWYALHGALPALWRWLVRWNERVVTREALEACSDRTLADIGIPREHIDLVAKGIDHRDPVTVSQHGWQPRLAAAVHHLGFVPPEQRRVLRELGAYSDPELDDIGIRRSDIPAIARAA